MKLWPRKTQQDDPFLQSPCRQLSAGQIGSLPQISKPGASCEVSLRPSSPTVPASAALLWADSNTAKRACPSRASWECSVLWASWRLLPGPLTLTSLTSDAFGQTKSCQSASAPPSWRP